MTVWICRTCGIEYPDTAEPPSLCRICSDDRQYLGPDGQVWTSHAELAGRHEVSFDELEPGLTALSLNPVFGIGHRALLLALPGGGNLLWEPVGYLDDALVEQVRARGGLTAVAVSHPHLVGAAVSWSRIFGVPFHFNGADRRWVCRPDPAVRFWQGRLDLAPGVTLHQCGGHFPGSSVAHWAAGAGGAGVLLTGDTIAVAADRRSVSFLRSYPNMIPLPPRLVRGIADTVRPLAFDRIYGGFGLWGLPAGAARAVQFSADRYIGWVTDVIRDPDDPGGPPDPG